MIDLHCHVLPAVDDGVRTLDEAVELARAAQADGVTAIAATPHVRHGYPTRVEVMEARVREVNDALAEAGVEVRVLTGGEIALDFLPSLSEDELARFGLGGNPRLLLLEFPYSGWPSDLGEVLSRLHARGIVVLLAHPERNADVREDPERLRAIVEGGAYVQLTAASVDGRLGPSAQDGARALLDLGLAHVISSDAHHPQVRAVGMSAARAAVGDGALGRWLTEDVPRALVAGEQPPPRPAAESTRGGWRRIFKR